MRMTEPAQAISREECLTRAEADDELANVFARIRGYDHSSDIAMCKRRARFYRRLAAAKNMPVSPEQNGVA